MPIKRWVLVIVMLSAAASYAEELRLEPLIDEAQKNSPEIKRAEAIALSAGHRVPQSSALPDPMFELGYQNGGLNELTYGDSMDAQIMYGVSQPFLFPGKRGAKGTMARKDAEAAEALLAQTRLSVVERIKDIYYDLFLSYKTEALIDELSSLFAAVEDSALARYANAMGTQQEVLMSQREKYMLAERKEMQRQKKISLEAMLYSTLGRATGPFTPVEPPPSTLETLEEYLSRIEGSPFFKEKTAMLASSESRLKMARLERYPDFALSANYFQRGNEFEDMWSLTASFNLPIFYAKKQKQAVSEADATLSASEAEVKAARLMLDASVREAHQMAKSADVLMTLYKEALIPKSKQDFEAALAGYRSGKVEALTAVSSLKGVLDAEISYWERFTEREKAIAKLETLTGGPLDEK